MSLANDKIGHHVRLISSNALLSSTVIRSGFQNVISADTYAFVSGNRSINRVYCGEEAPSTNYDSIALINDEYIQLTYTSGVVSAVSRYLRTANGWEKILTANDADWFDLLTVTNVTTAGAATFTSAQIEGGIITRDPSGADRTDVMPTAALLVAGITSCAVGSSVRFQIKNTSDADELITLSAGAGGTHSPTDIYIKPGQTKELLAVVTNATLTTEAYTLYDFDAFRDHLAKFAVTDDTADAKTWTAANLLAGLLLRDPNGGDRSDVTPTAALIVAAVPDARVGSTFEFIIVNTANAAETITLTAGAGVTLVPTSITITQNSSSLFVARITNVGTPAVSIYEVSSTDIANEAVTLAKMADLAQGSLISGQGSDRPGALDAKGDAKILVGDGTDVNSVAVSGDVTIDNTGAVAIGSSKVTPAMTETMTNGKIIIGVTGGPNIADVMSGDVTMDATGAVTIAADSVENTMLANITRGSVKVGGAADAPTDLDAKTSGQILVGDGTDLASVAVSGDATLAANGALTVAASAIDETMLGCVTGSGISTGAVACKVIQSAQLEALFDTNENTLFAFKTGDVILAVGIYCGTAAGGACTVDVGLDAVADGAAKDVNGFIEAADVNAAGVYESSDTTYDGAYIRAGAKVIAADGNMVIESSADQSGGAFVGWLYVLYIPA